MSDLITHALTQWQHCPHTMVGSQSKVFIWKETETYTKCIDKRVYEVWQKTPTISTKDLKWQYKQTITWDVA